MNEQNRPMNPPDEIKIDLFELLNVLYSHLLTILLCALLAGTAGYLYSTYRITPLYQANVRMLVNAKNDGYSTTVTAGDLASAGSLVDTYAVVIKSDRVLDRVIGELDLDMSWDSLNDMISVTAVPNTSVINIVCTAASPDFARNIVTKISEVAPEQIVDAVEAGSCKVLTNAYCSGYPISPNIKKYTIKCVMAGGAASAGLFLLLHLLNDTIQSEDQLADVTGFPVLSTIPVAEDSIDDKRHHTKKKGGK